MVDEKHLYDPHESLPIPTYEEATSSRPPSSVGPLDNSSDAEQQRLLGRTFGEDGGHTGTPAPGDASSSADRRRRADGYRPPTVQSVHSESDSDLDLDEMTPSSDDDDEDEEPHTYLRREMETLEIEEGGADAEAGSSPAALRRARMRARLQKRLSSLTTTLSSLHLPSLRVPGLRGGWTWLRQRLPTLTSTSTSSRLPTCLRMPHIPEHYRPSYAIIARLAGLFLIISLVYALVVTEMVPLGRGGAAFGQPFNPEWVRQFAQASVDPDRVRARLDHLASFPHAAGAEGGWFLAKWIEGLWREEGRMDDVELVRYEALLNFPVSGGRRVAIVDPPALRWEARIEEDKIGETPVFFGMSRAGNVTGRLVYANYGRRQDFAQLKEMGVPLEGSVVLVREGGEGLGLPGLKVKNAQDAGAAGCLIYSDPADEGFLKGKVAPDGLWMPEDGVHRGSVALTPWVIGDVLTPGWASTAKAKRLKKDDPNPGMPDILALPLAWRDAKALLRTLTGTGQRVPADWVGGVPDVPEWWTGGDGADATVVRLTNEQEEREKTAVYNVIGAIEGLEGGAKQIIVGNPRDAWCLGPADPGSGTAVLLEVARIFGELRAQDWRPLRTIVFASWDGGTYNHIGSTEFVEEHADNLRRHALAYLNVGAGVTGDTLRAAGSPVLRDAFVRVLDRIADPERNRTLRALWDEAGSGFGTLDSHGDHIPFQAIAGTSSVDFGFGPSDGETFPLRGSCYETLTLVRDQLDRTGSRHAMLVQLWVLLILELAQEPILPFDMAGFAAETTAAVQRLDTWVAAEMDEAKGQGQGQGELDLTPLHRAATALTDHARRFEQWEDGWYAQVYGSGGFESNAMAVGRMAHNDRMAGFESRLLDLPPADAKEGEQKGEVFGIPGREQYKHVLWAPDALQTADGAGAVFPAVRDAVVAREWRRAQRWVERVAERLEEAGGWLVEGLVLESEGGDGEGDGKGRGR